MARLPLALWIGAAVVVAHLLFFGLVWDKHFLPKVPPPPPAPLPTNFAARETQSFDQRTGATVITHEFTISTHFATPLPAAKASP